MNSNLVIGKKPLVRSQTKQNKTIFRYPRYMSLSVKLHP